MNNIVDNFLNKASSTGRYIEKKAKDITNITKLKFKISELNSKIQKEHIKLGAIIYDIRKNGADENESLINECLNNIDNYLEQVKIINEKLNIFDSDIICDVCGFSNNNNRANCMNCGNKLY